MRVMLSQRTYKFEVTSTEVNDLRTALRKYVDFSTHESNNSVHYGRNYEHNIQFERLTLRLLSPCPSMMSPTIRMN